MKNLIFLVITLFLLFNNNVFSDFNQESNISYYENKFRETRYVDDLESAYISKQYNEEFGILLNIVIVRDDNKCSGEKLFSDCIEENYLFGDVTVAMHVNFEKQFDKILNYHTYVSPKFENLNLDQEIKNLISLKITQGITNPSEISAEYYKAIHNYLIRYCKSINEFEHCNFNTIKNYSDEIAKQKSEQDSVKFQLKIEKHELENKKLLRTVYILVTILGIIILYFTTKLFYIRFKNKTLLQKVTFHINDLKYYIMRIEKIRNTNQRIDKYIIELNNYIESLTIIIGDKNLNFKELKDKFSTSSEYFLKIKGDIGKIKTEDEKGIIDNLEDIIESFNILNSRIIRLGKNTNNSINDINLIDSYLIEIDNYVELLSKQKINLSKQITETKENNLKLPLEAKIESIKIYLNNFELLKTKVNNLHNN